MLRTRVGYAGGVKVDPTYHSLGDHTESFQVDFDPKVISYAELLKVFWQSHNPCSRSYSTQYKAAVFFSNDTQRQVALKTRDELRGQRGTVYTDVLPLTRFYLAEDYHQKYRLRSFDRLEAELLAIYPKLGDFVNSTVAMRLNAWIAGDGNLAQFDREVRDLGLSAQAQHDLREMLKGRLR